MSAPSAGAIVLRRVGEAVECLLVRGPAGRWGFPKGRREQGETETQCAVRELEEETSIHESELTLEAGASLEDRGPDGRVRVRYLVARVEGDVPVEAEDERSRVEWTPVAEARDRLSAGDLLMLAGAVERLRAR